MHPTVIFTFLIIKIIPGLAVYSFERAIQQAYSLAQIEIKPTLDDLKFHNSIGKPGWIFSHRLANIKSTNCTKQIEIVGRGLLERASWSYSWIDASGKLPSGILQGAFLWYGSYDECKKSTAFDKNNETYFNGRYCSIFFPLNITTAPMPIGINYGICVPDECEREELLQIINSSPLPVKAKVEESACHKDVNELDKDAWFYCALTLCAFLLILMFAGSATELVLYTQWWYANYKQRKLGLESTGATIEDQIEENGVNQTEWTIQVEDSPSLYKASEMSVQWPRISEVPYLEHRSDVFQRYPLLMLLCAYSVPYNAWKLWSTGSVQVVGLDGVQREHPLTCLDGIRCITMMWIVFGHLLLMSIYVSNNIVTAADKVTHSPGFEIVLMGTLSVDTFFFMSGLLTTYLTLNRYRATHTAKSRAKFWGWYVLHRFLRLTPAYLFVIIVYTGLFIHSRDGPLFPQDHGMFDFEFCRRNWYLTYINNLVKSDQMCIAWSWYLSNDMQFSLVLAPIFITLLALNRICGLLFAVALIISSSVAAILITYYNNFTILPMQQNWFAYAYVRPYTRWGTYAIGMMLGWILVDYPRLPLHRNLRNRILVALVGIIVSSAFTLAPLYGPYGVTSGQLPPLEQLTTSFYHGLSRPSFVFGIAIVVYLCATGWLEPFRYFLAWSGFRIGARLTYGVYLLHPVILTYVYFGALAPVQIDNLFLVSGFLSIITLSYLASFVLSMATESPTIVLERFLRQARSS